MARNQYQPPQFKTSNAEPHAFGPPDLLCMLNDGWVAYRSQSLQTQKLIEIRAPSIFVLLAWLLSSCSKSAWKTDWCDMFSLRNDTFLQEDRGCLSESTHSLVHFLCTKGLSSFPLVSLYRYRYILFMAGKFKAAISRLSLEWFYPLHFWCTKDQRSRPDTIVFHKSTDAAMKRYPAISEHERLILMLHDWDANVCCVWLWSYWLLREHPSTKFM